MIKSKTENGRTTFHDDSGCIGKLEVDAVRAAMAAGFTEFTTPTIPDDQGRNDWQVRRWVTSRDGRPVAFLVANLSANAHLEVLGPEIDLTIPSPSKRNGK